MWGVIFVVENVCQKNSTVTTKYLLKNNFNHLDSFFLIILILLLRWGEKRAF